ncbi:hypothetical protein PWT90_01501 [Aphanocladium album]|nr:hypothetical protein PWT90_01501 [Aphanocladium album]
MISITPAPSFEVTMSLVTYFLVACVLLSLYWVLASSEKKLKSPINGTETKRAPKVDNDTIVPLNDFDWATTDAIPYRPFQNKQHVAMGVKKMPKMDWIRMDKGYLKRLDERLEIMEAHPAESIGSGPEVNPAIEELYEELMLDYLPRRYPTMFALKERMLYNKITGKSYSVELSQLSHDDMLRNLGENVEEDFYFMCPDENDEPRLQGWLACFPGGFLTTSRKGMSMREIHQPVPGYEQRIGKGADKVLARLGGNEYIERYNWSLQPDGEDLFRVDGNNFYPEQGDEIPDEESQVKINDCYLRVEHQTLVRLRRSRAVVFCVRSYMTSLHDIRAEGNGPLLADAFESMPHKLGNYKKRPFWQTQVYKFLRMGME